MEAELKTKDVLTEDSSSMMIDEEEEPRPKFALRIVFQKHYPPGFIKKVAAEIIARFLLVFVTCGSAALSTSDEHRVSKFGSTGCRWAYRNRDDICSWTCFRCTHESCAVTLAFATVRHFPWKQVPFYVAAQLAGAVGASFMNYCTQ